MNKANLDLIENHRRRSIEVVSDALQSLAGEISATAQDMIRCLEMGGRIMCCGNGGSAADALHFSAELLNRYATDRQPLAAICLNCDVSTLTSIANDYHFSEVFAKQVSALGRPGDMLLAITTSGNSDNILKAQERAREAGVHTVLLTGRDGGAAAAKCGPGDRILCVADQTTAHIQEAHGAIIHCACALIERHFTTSAGE